MEKKKMGVGVIGCGMISTIYMKNMKERFSNIDLIACSALHIEHARKKAETFGIEALTVEELLADERIEIVVVLTPVHTHFSLIKQVLLAGKHVYCEKTITTTTAEAREIMELAEQKGLYLGAAPDTFLGEAIQSATKAITEGKIGEVTGFSISANRDLDWLIGIFRFLQAKGAGILYDYAVYHLTALVSMLGAVDEVAAFVMNRTEERMYLQKDRPDYGKTYLYQNESQAAAIIRMGNGAIGTLSVNGESNAKEYCDFIIYGKKGMLRLGDPNRFSTEVVWLPNEREERDLEPVILNSCHEEVDNLRGIGVSDMISSILDKKRNKANKELAYHVLDVIESMVRSGENHSFEHVLSTYQQP